MNTILSKGCLAGLIATLASILVDTLGNITFNINTTIDMLASLIFPNQELNLLKLFFGLVVHLTAGCLLGIFIALIFRQLKYEFPYSLGIIASLIFWIIHTMLIPNLAAGNVNLFRSEVEVIIDLVSHLLYGFVVMLYLDKNLGRDF